jgi:hypothetical protein
MAGGYRTLDQLAALQADPETPASFPADPAGFSRPADQDFPPAVNRSASAPSVVAVAESASSYVLLCSRTGN